MYLFEAIFKDYFSGYYTWEFEDKLSVVERATGMYFPTVFLLQNIVSFQG